MFRNLLFVASLLAVVGRCAAGPIAAGAAATVCCTAHWFWWPAWIPGCLASCAVPIPAPTPFDPSMVCQLASLAALAAPTP